MAPRFKIEHLAVAPQGYKVRTVTRGAHRVRIAFPPGRRRKGSGVPVEVLHPRGENPGQRCRYSNPAELVVMMNPAKPFDSRRAQTRRDLARFVRQHPKQSRKEVLSKFPYYRRKANASVEELELKRLKLIGKALRTIPHSPRQEKIKAEIREVERQLEEKGKRFNPSQEEVATGLYEKFHGMPSEHIEELKEPSPRSKAMVELGQLLELRVKPENGSKWGSLDLTGRDVTLACNSAGTQLYCVGGDQSMTRGQLSLLGADASKELLDLGEARYVAYRTKKAMTGGKTASWEHGLGEETGRFPRLQYDRRGSEPRLVFVGGEYHVDAPGIIN